MGPEVLEAECNECNLHTCSRDSVGIPGFLYSFNLISIEWPSISSVSRQLAELGRRNPGLFQRSFIAIPLFAP